MAKGRKVKKSKVLISAAAVALAASMIIGGGTYAYLQNETEDTVNKFNANQVTVDLDETTGSEYEIIPGTVQEKDPKVTVNTTVPAYVYVTVDDQTNGLVDYEIEQNWTKLDGYDNVYYREVAPSDEAQAFYVLADNQVSYNAALENGDMTENGQLKDGLELTFKAYAIQKDGFADAAAAWNSIPAQVTTEEEAVAAIEAGKAIVLQNDLTVSSDVLNNAVEPTIDANGNVLTVSGSAIINVNDVFTVKNGTVDFSNKNANGVALAVNEGAVANFENVDSEMSGSILIDFGIESATVNVVDSTIKVNDYYGISTNASDATSGRGVVINVINSEITAADPANSDCTGILMNVPGTLTIDHSTITGGRQAVIVRTGIAEITDSTLICTLNYAPEANWSKYDNGRWGSGNEVPVAVLVAGDRSTAYPWDTNVTLDNVTLTFGKETARAPIYAAAYDGQTTTISGISADIVTVSSDGDGVIINP